MVCPLEPPRTELFYYGGGRSQNYPIIDTSILFVSNHYILVLVLAVELVSALVRNKITSDTYESTSLSLWAIISVYTEQKNWVIPYIRVLL